MYCIGLLLLLICPVPVVAFQDLKRVHAFYYLWYGNVAHDGKWSHWNHEILPHWTEAVNRQYPQIGTYFAAPEDIHSPFYPLRGPYSSQDRDIIREHFNDMVDNGISVAVLSWWGQKSRNASTDTQGVSSDNIIPLVLDVADSIPGISIAFHLEPYPGRTALSTRDDIIYIHETYG